MLWLPTGLFVSDPGVSFWCYHVLMFNVDVVLPSETDLQEQRHAVTTVQKGIRVVCLDMFG